MEANTRSDLARSWLNYTRGLEAVCINLPWKTSPQEIFDYRLRADGKGHLVVRGPHGRALAVVDMQTFKILSAVKDP